MAISGVSNCYTLSKQKFSGFLNSASLGSLLEWEDCSTERGEFDNKRKR